MILLSPVQNWCFGVVFFGCFLCGGGVMFVFLEARYVISYKI